VAGKNLRCVVVTPEKAVVDSPAESVTVPLFDGQSGFLPGRAPLVGRLKPGPLTLRSAGKTQVYFIDGGIVQMKGEVITILTGKAMEKAQIDVAQVQKEIDAAGPPPSASASVMAEARAARERARVMLRVAKG